MAQEKNMDREDENKKGEMTVEEAGRKGGQKTSETHGREFYSDIGHKGGERVRELVDEGKKNESNEEDDER